MELKLVTVGNAAEEYPTEQSLYEKILSVDSGLDGCFRIKFLFSKGEFLLFGPADVRDVLSSALVTLNIMFIDENDTCLFITNIPQSLGEEQVREALGDFGISHISYIDFFKLNARGTRSAKVFAPNYFDTSEGRELLNDIQPTAYASPVRIVHLPPPFSQLLYMRLWVPRPRERVQRDGHRRSPHRANRSRQRQVNAQPNNPPKLVNSSQNDSMPRLIEQNEKLLEAAEKRHQEYIVNLQNLNDQMKDSNVQMSQIVRRLALIDEKLELLLPTHEINQVEELEPLGPPEPEATQTPNLQAKAITALNRKRQHSTTASPADLKRSKTAMIPTLKEKKNQMKNVNQEKDSESGNFRLGKWRN